MFHKWLQRVGNNVRLAGDEVLPMKPGHKVDVCLIQQLETHITNFKVDLNDISNGVLSADLDGDKELMKLGLETDKLMFKVGLRKKRLFHAQLPEGSPSVTDEPIKLPEIEVLIFDENFQNWQEFWEQFNVSVHQWKQLSNTAKLAYLKHALKDGPAKHVVEGHCSSMNCLINCSHASNHCSHASDHVTMWNRTHHCLSSWIIGFKYPTKLIWWAYLSCTSNPNKLFIHWLQVKVRCLMLNAFVNLTLFGGCLLTSHYLHTNWSSLDHCY